MPEYRTYAGLDDRISKDGDVGFIGFNNRMRPDQLPPNLLADAQNIRTDRRGEAQVRKGLELIVSPLSAGGEALAIPFYLVADDTSVTATQTGGAVVLTNVTATNFPSSGTVNVSGVSGLTPVVNGDRAFTKNSSTQITIADQTYSGTASGTATVKFGILNDGAVNAIYGSCAFSDPNASASQYVIFAANSKAVAVNIATGVTTDLVYPAGVTLSDSASMLQAFNKVFIFRDGNTALENNLTLSIISSATVTGSSNTANITTSTNHNLVTGDLVTIHNLGFSTTDPNGSAKTITRVDDTTFTYSLTASGDETYTVSSTSLVSTDFKKVASGTYTQPIPLSLTDIDYADGIATATASTAAVATLLVGDTLTFTDAGNSTYTLGDTIVVKSIPSTTTFTFITDKADTTNKNGTVQKRVSVGLGFSHMPAPPYAVYHERRLVMPFKFDVDASTDSFSSRGTLDEIIASDLLDSDTYDQIYAQYRFNAGEADFNVGLHSFSEDNLMVFNRNSIHLVTNTTSLQAASARLLTNEVGCVARQSITQVGNQVIFLSDNGVYSTQFFDEYNLRGTETPLSEAINVTIKRINKAHWDKSVAVYFDNRYFLAVPLDDSTKNNAIIIYNFLNKQWESIDQVNDTDFHISNLLVVGEGDARGVYAVNDIGGVQKLDERVDGVDRIVTQIGGDSKSINVPGSLTTRQYTLGNLERKNWKQFEMHIESGASTVSNFDISAETENPDADLTLGTLSDFVGSTLAEAEDVSIRGRIGNRRGYGIQFTINNTLGRPKIRAVEADGSISFRSTNKAE
tara:strand:+ start:1099 stop:3495 length:2397 start_codon:yes stop_codon:yes gene_type:complete